MNNRLKAIILTELLESSSDDEEELLSLFSSSSSSYSESESETETKDDNSSDLSDDTDSKNEAQLQPEQPSNVDNFMNTVDGYSDDEFKLHFGMQRSTVEFLATSFSSSVFTPSTLHGGKARIGARKEAYLYIFYITNTMTFTSLGNLFGVSKSSSWLAVGRVAKWLITIGHKYVQWPTGPALKENQQKFESDKKIPGVIGVIACSHIQIKAPKVGRKYFYRRGTTYSIILQAVVDADKKFLDVYCGEPGSLNENIVLHESELFERTQHKYSEMFPDSAYILGDAAYSPKKWLVPLYEGDALTDSQKSFNLILSETRMVTDDAFALLKSRFRKLTDFMDQTNVPAVTNLVVSACVMHNICILKNDVYLGEIIPEIQDDWQPRRCLGDVISSDGSRRRVLLNHLLQKNII